MKIGRAKGLKTFARPSILSRFYLTGYFAYIAYTAYN